MDKRCLKSALLGLSALFCFVVLLLSAVRLPVMEVVRSNLRTGVDADAYFYSDIEGFEMFEERVRELQDENAR